jgi:hypothetical protein
MASDWARSRAYDLGNEDAIEVGNAPSLVTVAMDIIKYDDNNEHPSSVPSLFNLSYDSASTSSSIVSDDSWAERLMGEDLIPES